MKQEDIVGYLYWLPVITCNEVPEKAMQLVSINSYKREEKLHFSMKAGILNAIEWCKKKNTKPIKFLINGSEENVELFISLYQVDERQEECITLEKDRQTASTIKKLLKND